jgi:hypothetical protein
MTQLNIENRYPHIECQVLKNKSSSGSIIERAEHGNTALDPMRLRLIGGHSDHKHEVGGVTSGHEGSSTITSLIDGAIVMLVVLDILLDARLEPNHGRLDEEDFGITFVKHSLVKIPLASFDKHTINIDTVFRSWRVLFLNDLKVEDQAIDGNTVLSGVVLNSTCEETLSEVELVDPEELRNAMVDPVLEELQTRFKVSNVTSERLERGIGFALPKSRHLTIKQGFKGIFELS